MHTCDCDVGRMCDDSYASSAEKKLSSMSSMVAGKCKLWLALPDSTCAAASELFSHCKAKRSPKCASRRHGGYPMHSICPMIMYLSMQVACSQARASNRAQPSILCKLDAQSHIMSTEYSVPGVG
jgi:hypothetical protein